jgi:alkylation response protein AidB-like acyl-CoA dehydrogenase
LHGVRLTPDDVVGGSEAGHGILGPAVARARVRHAAYLLGMAEGAFREAVAYTRARRQFGRPIAEFQSVEFRLASWLGHLQATRVKVRYAAQLQDANQTALRVATETLAMAAELALEVTRGAMHLHGAYGMTRAAPIQRFYRRAALEAVRGGVPDELWDEAGRLRRGTPARETSS